LKTITDLMNASALVAVVVLFIGGYLISRPTLEKHILAPRDQRIEALEKAMAKKDEDIRRLLEEFAKALGIQSQVVDRLFAKLDKGD
jgi:hypothetical protein